MVLGRSASNRQQHLPYDRRYTTACLVLSVFVCLGLSFLFFFIIITTTTIIIIITTTTMIIIKHNNNNNDNNNNSKVQFEISLQSPHCAANRLQHVRSSGSGAIVCTYSGYHVQSVVLSTTWYEGTAQLLSLTELKSHLYELYFNGWTITHFLPHVHSSR